MCGIAGIIDASIDAETRRARVERMCTAMLHRGPDAAGLAVSGKAALGSRRLAIFDPAHGNQPMTAADGRHVLVFNGAIYNFRELRGELESAGAVFRTQCDTEVLLVAWTKWGAACLSRLRGMFAFAVWDTLTETLSLARDRFGIKPLYFSHRGERLAFASELSALSAGIGEALTIDPVSVSQYLGWLTVPAPRTIFRDVASLRPGEIATFANGRLEVASWSHASDRAADSARCSTREEFTRELRSRLEDSIRAHCLADVPVGAFLSGGLDSSSIVALMSRQTGAKLKTFSIGFHERDWDESDHAAEIARQLGTDHETRIVTGPDLARELPQILAALDQPTGDGINTYLVSRLAHDGGVKVALSGLGADELFGGYPSFQQVPALVRWLSWWQRVPASGRRAIVRQLRKRDTGARKLADILEHGRNVHEVCALHRRVFGSEQMSELLNPEHRDTLASTSWHHPSLSQLASNFTSNGYDTDLRAIVSRWERETYMTDVLLRDSDVMSMRHSLELRVPFVDRPLLDWLENQRSEFRFDAERPKSALFDAVRDLLPPQLEHRQKRGFTLPFSRWMKEPLRPFLDETFSEVSLRRSGFFSPAAAQGLWRAYLHDSDTRQWSRVWSLAVLVNFVNRHSPPLGSLGSRNENSNAFPSRQRRTFLLLAPELYANEGGIARMLRVYLRALTEIGGPDDRVRFISLNDSLRSCENGRSDVGGVPSPRKNAQSRGDGTPPTFQSLQVSADSLEQFDEWRACSGDKARFVAATLQLARDCDELICGHVAQLPVALLARTVNPRLRISLVAHGIEVWRRFTSAEQLALERVDQILCVSRFTRDEMLRWVSLPPSRMAILPNALDPAWSFAGASENRHARQGGTILTVSRLDSSDRYKGIDHLIEALPEILRRFPAARLRIIGRGNDAKRLEQIRHDLSLESTVTFLGSRTDREVADELAACNVFALPSSREGFGLVFLEAMANGRPCVGVRAGAVPELISPHTGILVQPNNVSALAHGCIDALERTWDHSAIIARAKEFSYSVFKERLASFVHATSPSVQANPLVTHP
jgi:asparagine synthase (glutamine-hydrolysing)